MSNTLWIKVKESGNLAEVNRSTAGEMVQLGYAEFADEKAVEKAVADRAAAEKAAAADKKAADK